jgi:hypothetical protein
MLVPMNEDGSKKETEMRSGEATKVLDMMDNVVRDVSLVAALVSEKVVECEDDAEMDEEESEKGSERKAGRASVMYNLQYMVDMNAECKPYLPLSEMKL